MSCRGSFSTWLNVDKNSSPNSKDKSKLNKANKISLTNIY